MSNRLFYSGEQELCNMPPAAPHAPPIRSSTGISSARTSSTAFHPDKTTQYATIIDIDTSIGIPADSITQANPSIHELTKGRGPVEIMNAARSHKAHLRWIHLGQNCMAWVEDLMDKICEEQGIQFQKPPERERDPRGTVNPLLRQDLWGNLYHGRESKQIHSRFMRPMCSPFAVNIGSEDSDSNGSSAQATLDNMVLYLPFLHWETSKAWEERKDLIKLVSDNKAADNSAAVAEHADGPLLQEYLYHKSPLHDRRSLYQAYYYKQAYTNILEDNQILQKFTSADSPAEKMIVVDQLWLWVIKNLRNGGSDGGLAEADIVVTAFPGRFSGEADPSANVFEGILAHLKRGLEPPLKSTNDLSAVILEHCTGVFFQRQLSEDLWFLELYANAIHSVRQKQNKAFKAFSKTSEGPAELESQDTSIEETSTLLDERFAINTETELTVEIKSIIEGLNCIDFFSGQQQDVLFSLIRHHKARNFSSRSLRQVCEIVKERRDAWAGIRETARQTYSELRDQMDLKQKQANVFEARSSRRQAETSARHGRIILLLTIVTIIFLPMSFLTAWFGMNAKGINQGSNLSFGFISAIVFPISISISIFALILAFSEGLRNIITELAQGVMDVVLETTGVNRDRRYRGNRRTPREETEDDAIE